MRKSSAINPFVRGLDRLQPSESVLLTGAAIAVGLTSALGVWLFKFLIGVIYSVTFLAKTEATWANTWIAPYVSAIGPWAAFLIPVIGGLVVGLIMMRFVSEERHHGIAGIMEAVALTGGRLPYRQMPAKAIAAAISIGAGASVGPEDPLVQIGANLGSFVGQIARLSDDRMRTLVAAGAAAGIAAAFNAPIAGVFFAIEVILGEFNAGSLGAVTLAAVTSAVLTQAITGPQPAFHVPIYAVGGLPELPFYLLLGLIAGPIAAAYILLLDRAGTLFHRMSIPRWTKPIIGGVIVGIAGIWLPQLFGIGYETIGAVLNGETLAIGLVLALLVGKLLLTPISIGAGFPGGVFAPSLFIGAMAGNAFGQIVSAAFPQLSITPAAFAMVGMAAVLAGALHMPLTAILLLFEMTNDYHIILPLTFAVTVSVVIAQKLQRDSVYTRALARKGVRLERGRDVELLTNIRVDEVMERSPSTLRATQPLSEASDWLFRTRHHGVTIVDAANRLCGILTLQDVERSRIADRKLPPGATVDDVCTHEVLTAFPDESIDAAMRRMGTRDIGRLPVVAREDTHRLIGVLRRADMVRAYDVALTRRAELRQRGEQVRLGVYSGARVQEITIQPGALCADRSVSATIWPRDCVIASIRRGSDIIVPRGDTLVCGGDVLVLVAKDDAAESLRELSGN